MFLYIRVFNWAYASIFKLLFGRFFGAFGRGTKVLRPVGLEGVRNIHLGCDVVVGNQSLLAVKPLEPSISASLHISSGSRIGRFNHIYATRKIVLEERVLTANGVYISDNRHSYKNPDIPVFEQPITQLNDVTIGKGTWLGQNVCVMGASIGRNCVIGANSVVLSDIPDNSVAVGTPAKIIRRFDVETKEWRRTSADGVFTDSIKA